MTKNEGGNAKNDSLIKKKPDLTGQVFLICMFAVKFFKFCRKLKGC
jgi:hypothetical protein